MKLQIGVSIRETKLPKGTTYTQHARDHQGLSYTYTRVPATDGSDKAGFVAFDNFRKIFVDAIRVCQLSWQHLPVLLSLKAHDNL